MNGSLQLTSPVFADGDIIPKKYTCKGINVSPPLEVHHVPAEAASLALILHDPDAPSGDFLHWSIWNLGTDIVSLSEDEVPDGARQGTNDFGKVAYGGPCPPSGTHRYIFELYALDAELAVDDGADREELMEAIDTHIVAQATLTGTVTADGEET
ncbi:MAG TPA: YbhB/YbcL family Raf kinase inhibitor-like protein [Candidatus Saccharimonadales bacterium]|nr:YbhB/YbcL family Raf kinase inhibitor-like protein [Candidatus Saccharimonadales bacterium]